MLLSVIGGWLAAPGLWGGTDYFASFLAPVFAVAPGAEALNEATAHQLEIILAIVAVASALIGLGVAYWLYLRQPDKPGKIAKSMRPIYNTLLGKYYVDEFYDAVVIKPLMWVSTNVLWKIVDVAGIDGTVNGIATGTTSLGDTVRHAQSGNTRSYAVWVIIGALVIIAVIFFWPAARPVVGMVR